MYSFLSLPELDDGSVYPAAQTRQRGQTIRETYLRSKRKSRAFPRRSSAEHITDASIQQLSWRNVAPFVVVVVVAQSATSLYGARLQFGESLYRHHQSRKIGGCTKLSIRAHIPALCNLLGQQDGPKVKATIPWPRRVNQSSIRVHSGESFQSDQFCVRTTTTTSPPFHDAPQQQRRAKEDK